MLYGIFNEPPKGLDAERVGFDYAPYGQLFSRSAVVVHQGGIGTTSQVLRAGVPMLVMPYSHDQPDNAARCKRLGVAEVINRNNYKAEKVVPKLKKILTDLNYKKCASETKNIVDSEGGTFAACNEIEKVLQK